MTLKKRIIPVLLIDDTLQVVKPIKFGRPYRRLGPLSQYMRVMEQRNVDELIILDICASERGYKPMAKEISNFTSNLFCPCTIGGGIRSLDDISNLLNHGADKVAINNICIYDPEFIKEAAQKFGSQAIVGVMDILDSQIYDGKYLFDPDWTTIVNYAQYLESYGVGEILLTDVERDGTMAGYNIDLISTVAHAVGVPVIANGGCGRPSDMLLAINSGASAVAVGSMFLYTDVTPKECASYLNDNGIAVRL